ncbi:MtrB/PioB family decaheme-associated outer membrane protein [Thioalkalivibrio sp.]|uniref:MtrB/PioB family decaheme-associated outer membrane protein n=1 Tax=Thioalkalivibrio sp. TaxID=2093813 RepID=UPI0039765415
MNRHTAHFMPKRLSLAIALALTASLSVHAQQDQDNGADSAAGAAPLSYWPQGDTERWECSQCPDVSGTEGDATVGVGYVSDESAYFGRYTGLDDDGPYFLGGVRASYRSEDEKYLDLDASDLGLDSRSLGLRGGERGRYRAYLNYDQIPGFVAENARTPFRGVGSTQLTLPADWERANATGAMGRLNDSLADVNLDTRRDRLGVGVEFWRGQAWDYGIDYQRTEQDGFKIQGGSFLTTASLLPVEIDRVTDQIDARIAYREQNWHAAARYHVSLFNNKADTVTWDNPFSLGGEQGRMAQEPDNRFHQVTLSGGWRPTSKLNTSGRLAIGRMEQDDSFLAPTINPNLVNPGVPRSDLDGRVNTLTGNLRAVYAASSRLTVTGEGFYDDRDNRTGRDDFVQVGTDTFIGPARINRPYSYERLGGRLIADFRASDKVRLSAGGRAEQVERTFQEVDQTETAAGWGEIRGTPTDRVDMTLRLTREERRLDDDYTALPDVLPEENPLLRKFHLASRDRDQVRADIAYMVSERVSLGFSGDYAKDDYDRSRVGLIDARDVAYTVDISAAPRDNLTVSAFYGRERIESTMASSAAFGFPDWTGDQEDTIDSFGLTLEARDVGREGFDAGIDYGYSSGKGQITMRTGAPVEPLPELKSRLNTVKLYGRYRVNDRLSVRVDYLYERFRSKDFTLDDVAPDTIPSVLTLDEETPNYTAHFIGTSLNYRF